MEELPEFKFCLRDDLLDHPEFLPTRSEPLASGWDVRCAEPDGVILKPFEHYMIRLGFRAFCPPGFWYELKPRSSSFTKKQLHSLYGTIDEAYQNELVFACQYIPLNTWKEAYDFASYPKPQKISYFTLKQDTITQQFITFENCPIIEFGERIGQIIPVKRQEMKVTQVSKEEYDDLCKNRNAVRKTGGFGSSGLK